MTSYEEYERTQRHRHIADVGEGVYFGAAAAAVASTLADFGIDTVIHLVPFTDTDKVGGVMYVGYDLNDDAADAARMVRVAREVYVRLCSLVEEGRRVLVCCSQGKSRSAAVITYWLMNRHCMGAAKAIERIAAVRKININPGFRAALGNIRA
jgi:hypothetical protein